MRVELESRRRRGPGTSKTMDPRWLWSKVKVASVSRMKARRRVQGTCATLFVAEKQFIWLCSLTSSRSCQREIRPGHGTQRIYKSSANIPMGPSRTPMPPILPPEPAAFDRGSLITPEKGPALHNSRPLISPSKLALLASLLEKWKSARIGCTDGKIGMDGRLLIARSV
jgi:hypothetical protein